MTRLLSVRRLSLFALLIGGLSLGLVACDSGGVGSDPEENETAISDKTVVVDSSDASLQQMRGDTLTFSLSESAPDFESGDIVVGAESGGFLRRVTAVEIDGNQATLQTEQASLVNAVESGELSESFDLSGSQRKNQGRLKRNGWKAVRTAKGVKAKANELGIELADVTVSEDAESEIEVVFTNGEASFDPAADFDIEIGGGSIEELRIAASGTAEFSTDVEVAATNTLSKENSTTLATFRKPPIVFFIGPVPVTIQPTLDFVAGYESTVEQTGSVQFGFESSETVTLGAEYMQDNWSPISEREKSLGSDMFDWGTELTADAKGYVRPELTFKLYQVAGPFINTGPYVLADAMVNPESWYWKLNGGIDASFGGKVEIISFELSRFEHTFSLAETEIASDSGAVARSEATISGTITDEETGDPVEGATVTGSDADTDAEFFETETDVSGEYEETFTVDNEPSKVALHVNAEGYEAAEETVPFGEEMTADLTLTDESDPGDGVYVEDFSSDPNYTVSYSGNTEDDAEVEWDADQENYYARVRDQTSDWWSVGISPSFEKLYPAEDSFELNFRFNPVEPDWGHYPGIYLVDSESYNPGDNLRDEAKVAAKFSINWADNTYKKFVFGRGDNRYRSPTIPNENEWYEVTIDYDGSTGTADLKIIRENGEVFVDEQNLSAVPTEEFDQLWVGEVGSGPTYGDEARIRVDDLTLTLQ
jgi:hypothetical protein